MIGKITTLEEWNLIHSLIMIGENIPRVENFGYKVTDYLGSYEMYKHPNQDLYYIPQDVVTEKYCSNFVELDETWINNTEEI